MDNKRSFMASILVFFALGCFAQGNDILSSAMQAYQQDSWEKAFSIIAEGIPESSADVSLKRQAADTLTNIGIQEYDYRNYRNAYEGFRKALKYDPTNARATQYFLKMRKEMDTANLKNEGGARAKPAAAAAPATTSEPAGSQAAPPAQASGTAATQPAGTPAAAGTPPAASGTDRVALDEVKKALEEADARMKSMESSVSSTSQENAQLRAQVEQQLKLLEAYMAAQATQATQAAQAPKPAASAPAAAPQQSATEKALIAQVMELLARMSERESRPPQPVTQPEQEKTLAGQDLFNLTVLIIVGVVVAVFVAFIVVLIVAMMRSRRRNPANNPPRYEGDQPQFATAQPSAYLGSSTLGGDTPLLEFIGSNSTAVGRPVDFDVRKDLLKAERLKRMYDEVRNGTLNWNTVREYIGELEVSLKAEILKSVEQKLNEGDLLSSEAILPILFPLLTDYDDFIREKSEKLAQRALAGPKGGGVSGEAGDRSQADNDPLSLRALMEIPNALQALFKNQEKSLVTAKLSRGMGNILGLSTDDCNLLYKSALAHDCGYLMLDRDRLQATIAKPEITEDDFAFIQSHVVKGSTYFGDIELPEEFKAGLLYHHERNDGTGYPDGLKKDAIPQFAKIIGVAETFAALVSKRAYRDKRDIQHALAIISDGTRSKFDAAIVEALVKVASSMGQN